MRSKKFRLQLLLIGGAVVLIVLLYLAPRNVAPEKETDSEAVASSAIFDVKNEVEAAKRRIGDENSAIISDLERRVTENESDTKMLERLAAEWELNNENAVAAHYYSEYAEKSGDAGKFLKAGDLYFSSYRSAVDSLYKQQMASLAIKNYEQAIEKGAGDNQTKTNLAVLLVETTPNPMRGITLLREVVEAEPENEDAQLQLGFFSYKSGQYDKAVERFEKVIEINPARTDVHLYIGETYLAMDNKQKAIESFEKFLKVSENPSMKREVQNYIEQVKNTN